MAAPSPDADLIQCVWYGVCDTDGTPATGSITMEYLGGLRVDSDAATHPIGIYPKKITTQIAPQSITTTDKTGASKTLTVGAAVFSVPASNDPDLLGSGGAYRVTETLTNATGRAPFNVVVDVAAAGGVVYLHLVAGGAPVEGVAYGAPAALSSYDNTDSGLTADDVQAAIDELVAGGGLGGGGDVTETELTTALATKADLVSGTVPLSQLPKSQTATASSIVQRDSSGRVAAADAAASSDVVNLGQANALIAAATTDVRYKRLTASSGLSSTNDSTWVNVPDLYIDDAATGQEWQVDLELAYTCVLAAPGIQVRIRPGSPGPTTGDWEIYGRWGPSLTTTATANSNHQLLVPVNYPTSTTLNASFGAAAAMSYVVASFLFRINGTGLTGRRIAFDFMQRVADGSNAVTLLQYASRCTFARVA